MMEIEEIRKLQKEREIEGKRMDRRLKELDELFNGQWGKLMESLVKGDLIKLLNQRNIEVQRFLMETQAPFGGKDYEYDIVAVNGEEAVVVEVKTTLRMRDVDHFMGKIKMFKKVWPEYADKKIYGAIAYLKANEGTDRNAQKKGLFVIRATGSSSSITNKKNFKPKVF